MQDRNRLKRGGRKLLMPWEKNRFACALMKAKIDFRGV